MKSASEIRERILRVVSKTGGHLASSLGAVELSMALAKVFEPERDRIVWDVGHQAYAWKILTGRDDRFDTLRQLDGLSGFPNPAESPADAAVSGHAGVALSVAAGYAAARDQRGSGEHVVAVVGDAAIANGVSFEALNNCAAATGKLIVVLNDNEMSISRPTGSFARFLGWLISGVRYNRVKMAAERAGHALKLTFLRGIYHRIETRLKSLFLANAFFEQFGLRYVGPVDGHDVNALVSALTVAKEYKYSVIVHIVTRKGKGFAPAERNPTRWHGVGPFAYPPVPESESKGASQRSWSDAFSDSIVAAAARDRRIVALTAAMTEGTGLHDFAARYPSRLFDVGIAEEHLVAFASGMAAGGLRPVVALYSTFLQRAVDQIMHDVCLASRPVVFAIDRAGVVGSDGATHHGLFDIAMLRCLPNMTICEPKDERDLAALLDEALARNAPTAIRYPRGTCPDRTPDSPFVGDAAATVRLALWATGDYFARACEVARRVPGVIAVHARYLKPFDSTLLDEERRGGLKIASLENGSLAGGFGESINADLRFGWPDVFIPHGSIPELERRFGLDTDSLVSKITTFLST